MVASTCSAVRVVFSSRPLYALYSGSPVLVSTRDKGDHIRIPIPLLQGGWAT